MQLSHMRCNRTHFLLAAAWFFGLLIGIFSAASASETLLPIMRGVVSCPVSIPGLLFAVYMPFLLSAFAAYFCPPLIYAYSVCKAFSFGYCAYGIILTFGNAAWLICFLFLFSDFCLLPVLYLFWLRHISDGRSQLLFEFLICLLIASVVACIDISWISPYLLKLYN